MQLNQVTYSYTIRRSRNFQMVESTATITVDVAEGDSPIAALEQAHQAALEQAVADVEKAGKLLPTHDAEPALAPHSTGARVSNHLSDDEPQQRALQTGQAEDVGAGFDSTRAPRRRARRKH